MKKLLSLILIFASFLIQGQDFAKADSIAGLYYGSDLKNVAQLSLDLSQGLQSQKEKFRALHTWVCQNIENDYHESLRVTKQRARLRDDSLALRTWDQKKRLQTIRKLYKQRKTVCTGYAYLLAQMSANLGIECRIINGYGRIGAANSEKLEQVNHSWNAVKLDGEWYLCDATWSSGIVYVNDGLGYFSAEYNDGYFLAPPKFFYRNHLPEKPDSLSKLAPTAKAFLNAPILYGGAFANELFPSDNASLKYQINKGDSLNFELEFKGKGFNQNLYVQIDNGFSTRELDLEYQNGDNGKVFTSLLFEKSGIYDVHLICNDDLIASYVVEVQRR